MVQTISVAESRELDDKTINKIGIPSMVLMERAGLKIYEDMLNNPALDLGKVLILAGTGNNGGDGLVVARLLCTHGYDVSIVTVGNPDHASEDHVNQQKICDYYQIPKAFMSDDFNKYTTLVDGLFGSGLSRNVGGDFATVIDKANASTANIHAIDIPSGLNGDTGEAMGTAIEATSTSTIAYAKAGMVKPGADKYTGKLFIDDIGIYKGNSFDNE
ncbi:NAD(P)H-hydrate epimerase [Lentilactobacillus kisonensis]|uniref:NAD(P)H-hydrate epimerase n=2 Tax=Lentilactobacillus kisonensis TaxID=481722 RepID=H1LBV0_9LACO|nr:NAD(P)H-hydrate epimerase [Lentilactobacillus kisonensis]EHO54500.1 YjeF-like protein [Lentilactobacillus kisonensis F0435]KRL22998.1 YjeF-like protein [Lentilactobacillus kisonensis DSM 19906 = JCM 15041]